MLHASVAPTCATFKSRLSVAARASSYADGVMKRIAICLVVVVATAVAPACTRYHRARTGSTERTEVVSRGRGAAEGLAIGVAAGAGIGVVAGLIDGDDCEDAEEFCLGFPGGVKAIMAGLMGAVAGAGTGALIGYIKGSRDVYEPSGPAPQVFVAPTRGGGAAALLWRF